MPQRTSGLECIHSHCDAVNKKGACEQSVQMCYSQGISRIGRKVTRYDLARYDLAWNNKNRIMATKTKRKLKLQKDTDNSYVISKKCVRMLKGVSLLILIKQRLR